MAGTFPETNIAPEKWMVGSWNTSFLRDSVSFREVYPLKQGPARGHLEGSVGFPAGNISHLYASAAAFAALTDTGAVVTWGDARFGASA